MKTRQRSPIATWLPAHRKRWRKLTPYGLVVHTSGRGIVYRALEKGITPIDLALDWYRKKGSVHYVIGYDGTIYQLLADDKRGAHVGISWLERRSYLSGRWESKVLSRAYRLWKARWPQYKSPQHLYPTRSPNACYLGVEVIPMGSWRTNGLWFTAAQHRAISRLAQDISIRHSLDLNISPPTPRLLGHEDLDAFARWDNHGGWDPGALRKKPRFSWLWTGVVNAEE